MKVTDEERQALLETVGFWAERTGEDPDALPVSGAACPLCRVTIWSGHDCGGCVVWATVDSDCAPAFDTPEAALQPTNASVLMSCLLLCEILDIDVERELGWRCSNE